MILGFLLGIVFTIIIIMRVFAPEKFAVFMIYVRKIWSKILPKNPAQSVSVLDELCPDKSEDCILEIKNKCPNMDEECLKNLSQMDYYLVGRENYILPSSNDIRD